MSGEVAIALALALVLTAVVAIVVVRTRRVVATPTERAVHAALHTASSAARALRRGLDTDSAQTAAPYLRGLTVTQGLALFDGDGQLLALDPDDDALWQTDIVDTCTSTARDSIADQRRKLTSARPMTVVAQPLLTEAGDVLGALVVVTASTPGPGMLGAVGEVARYAASQIELAELDASRARLDRAEVLALRAQISPHFIYNALNTIASFVRTDPDRARELILEFADFTRYSFRAAGQYTTLADELRNIDRYLTLERARFGQSLKVRLQVAPEVLNVVVPFLALQPLVENAVRHGLAGQGGGTVEIIARDEGTDCVITVEDDGAGMDPETLRAGQGDALADRTDQGAHVGLTNVDHRLRAAFGNDYGLVVETALGAGTKVMMRVPKFRSGVHAGGGAFG
ncbi:sensor histidine kinase [Mycolicibacterium smegmatis]|uniref:Two-component system sensor kinase n=4 Tax=Mycolicibacterium smegmatis TaxID=1772 RepID=I7GEV4_MYCS2|nr:histidine kinase [Mycolicibacterium smegmatis]ABK73324.1 sensor histidine kinase [Mycolicibacterium smegmatis MC2 155]AFP41469.1 Two-component system sensor kinase [Mycolicibacterium smegmatis MC2 155]AIU10193.1 histidine kinase [Mycolicibacterium smegmatis MC2 155]AIU16818.1 histidine kinase [Mycolicibacterium smegmatis]AIU23441.1 histidine kinase [Mycolicibacterium smegmatis]